MNHPTPDLFFNHGNRASIEEVKYLRIAQILSVDTVNMMCELNVLDKTATRSTVPLPLPMVYPGGGIIAVPTRGAHVVVGIRAMQMPLILAYYPFNTMAPDSYFQMYKQVYGMPETLQEGEIYIRARSDSAKCVACGVVSLLTAWEANIDTTTGIEQCPANQCNAPASVLDAATGLPLPGSVNKQFMGSTLRMTPQAELFYQADNIMSPEKGDTSRVFKLYINGVTGDVSFINANDISFQSNGNFYVGCQNFTVKADQQITETTQNKNTNTNQTTAANFTDHVMNATSSLTLQAQTLNHMITGFLNETMLNRTVSIAKAVDGSGGADTYEAASHTVFISGDQNSLGRITQIGLIDGSTTNAISDELDLYGAEVKNVYGTSTVTIVGASTAAYTSNYGLTVGGNLSQSVTGSWTSTSASANLTATGAFNLHGTNLIFNGGTLPTARQTDATVINAATDPTFINFFTLLQTFLTAFVTAFDSHVHTSAAAGSPTTPPTVPFVTPTVPAPPTTATGKITGGNTTVLA